MDRGRYAGPVGWLDARGDGEFGLALRCAELTGDDSGPAVRRLRDRRRVGPGRRAGRDASRSSPRSRPRWRTDRRGPQQRMRAGWSGSPSRRTVRATGRSSCSCRRRAGSSCSPVVAVPATVLWSIGLAELDRHSVAGHSDDVLAAQLSVTVAVSPRTGRGEVRRRADGRGRSSCPRRPSATQPRTGGTTEPRPAMTSTRIAARRRAVAPSECVGVHGVPGCSGGGAVRNRRAIAAGPSTRGTTGPPGLDRARRGARDRASRDHEASALCRASSEGHEAGPSHLCADVRGPCAGRQLGVPTTATSVVAAAADR